MDARKHSFLYIWALIVTPLSACIPVLSVPILALAFWSGSTQMSHWKKTTPILVCSYATLCFTTHFIHNYPLLGGWSFFSLTGLIWVHAVGKSSSIRIAKRSLLALALYWLWTNLGVWLFSGLYPSSLNGLMTCYIAALPFLRDTVLSGICWLVTIQLSWTVYSQESPLPLLRSAALRSQPSAMAALRSYTTKNRKPHKPCAL